MAVDLPHPEQLPSLQKRWRKNSGCRGCKLGDPGDGGGDSTSSHSVLDAACYASSLSESVTFWFGKSRRASFAREASPRSILQEAKTHLASRRASFKLCKDNYLQPSRRKFFFLLEPLIAWYTNQNCFMTRDGMNNARNVHLWDLENLSRNSRWQLPKTLCSILWYFVIGNQLAGLHIFPLVLTGDIYANFLEHEIPPLSDDIRLHTHRQVYHQLDGTMPISVGTPLRFCIDNIIRCFVAVVEVCRICL